MTLQCQSLHSADTSFSVGVIAARFYGFYAFFIALMAYFGPHLLRQVEVIRRRCGASLTTDYCFHSSEVFGLSNNFSDFC